MARPLRLEFPGALYHVTSRGDRREDIYLDDHDRQTWLELLGDVCDRFNWVVHAYCQMNNHYHLIIETADGNLSTGMRQLNGVYTQRFNRHHNMVGHLFQGRYKAILVQKETYLLELSRYVVLNPVRAGMTDNPEKWIWSSYQAMTSSKKPAEWLDSDWLLSQFGHTRKTAIQAYRRFVTEGKEASSPLEQTRHQLILGDDAFVASYGLDHEMNPDVLREISKAQKRSLALTLEEYQQHYPLRNEAMANAYRSGAYSMADIGRHFGVHYMTVSRAVRKFEESQ